MQAHLDETAATAAEDNAAGFAHAEENSEGSLTPQEAVPTQAQVVDAAVQDMGTTDDLPALPVEAPPSLMDHVEAETDVQMSMLPPDQPAEPVAVETVDADEGERKRKREDEPVEQS